MWMGGITGTLYKCSNCQYLGPIVIEDESSGTEEEDREYTMRLSRVNSTLNWVGLLFGVSFMAVGLIVGFSPLPLSGGSVGAYGLAVFAIGAVLVIASGLFWLIDRSRSPSREQVAPTNKALEDEN